MKLDDYQVGIRISKLTFFGHTTPTDDLAIGFQIDLLPDFSESEGIPVDHGQEHGLNSDYAFLRANTKDFMVISLYYTRTIIDLFPGLADFILQNHSLLFNCSPDTMPIVPIISAFEIIQPSLSAGGPPYLLPKEGAPEQGAQAA